MYLQIIPINLNIFNTLAIGQKYFSFYIPSLIKEQVNRHTGFQKILPGTLSGGLGHK